MDKQRIKISLERYKSHRPGLLPYIRFNDEDTAVKIVTSGDVNGNYGQFVCDLKHNIAGGDPVKIPYAEVIARYNEMQRILGGSAFTEKKTTTRNIKGKKDCTTNSETVTSETKVCLVETSPYGLNQYDLVPLNTSGFTYDNGYYFPEDVTVIQGQDLYVLIPEYDRYLQIEAWWKNLTSGIYDTSSALWNDPFFFCKVVEHDFLGLITVPENGVTGDIEGLRVPNRVYKQEAPEILEWFAKNANSESEDIQKEVAERGGIPFSGFLSTEIDNWTPIESRWDSGTPSIYITTMLSQECGYEGVYEVDWENAEAFNESDYIGQFNPSGASGTVITGITKWYSATSADTPVTSESMLYNLIDNNTIEIGGHVGTMASCNTLYEVTFKTGATFSNIPSDTIFVVSAETDDCISWWEFRETTDTPGCADGQEVEPNTVVYRTIPMFNCINQVVGTAPNYGDGYYFLVKKNCGGFKKTSSSTSIDDCESTPMRIPYTQGSFHNITNISGNIYNCDYLSAITYSDGGKKITFDYIIGGQASGEVATSAVDLTYIEETGIRYRETHDYHANETMIADIDNFYDVEFRYDWVDFDHDKEIIYNEEYRLSREANLATIVGMEIGKIFTEEDMIVAPIFTKEGSEGLMEIPKTKFNLVLDRGAAAAFENHFKLGECNSFEDLENYGNNYFNL